MFSGLVTAWRLATWPTSRSPSLPNADDGRGGAPALGVGDDDGLAALQDGDARIRGSEIDSDDLAHALRLLLPDLSCK